MVWYKVEDSDRNIGYIDPRTIEFERGDLIRSANGKTLKTLDKIAVDDEPRAFFANGNPRRNPSYSSSSSSEHKSSNSSAHGLSKFAIRSGTGLPLY